MAGGMFTKQADYLSAKFLNDVNDATQGGSLTVAPAGLTVSQGQQTQLGDRIVLDDATALALSDTAIGTLYGGLYMYILTTAAPTRAIVRGGIAFFTAGSIGTTYTVSSDAQPATATPSYIAGIFINVPTAGNYCWVQIAGIASVLFDSTITATTAGSMVSAKVSSVVASTADNAATVTQMTVACLLGVSVGAAAASTISKVALTRGFGRI